MPSDPGKIKGIAHRAAHWSATHRKLAIWGWLGFVVLAVFAGSSLSQKQLSDSDAFVRDSGKAERTIDDAAFDDRAQETLLVQNPKVLVTSPDFRATIKDVARQISTVANVENVETPLDGKQPVSKDKHSALIQYRIAGDSEKAQDKIEPVLKRIDAQQAEHRGYFIGTFGDASTDKEIGGAFEEDFKKAETLSIPITLIILVFAFGALVAAGIPVLLAVSGVAASIGLIAIPSQVLPVDDAIASVMLLIGMAVGVDYSLFYMRREREERGHGASNMRALDIAAATSGRAVLVSGLTVMVAMSGMFIAGDKTFMGFGMGTMLVVAVAMIGSLTVLPALMAWLGDRMYKLKVPLIGKRRAAGADSRIWSAIIGGVMRHPVTSVVLAGGFLFALTIPAFGLHLKVTGPDELPQHFETLKTYNHTQQAFPGKNVDAQVVIKAGDVRSPEVQQGIAALKREALASHKLLQPVDVDYDGSNTVAVVSLPVIGDGFNDTSKDALNTLRNDVIPATIGKQDTTVLVTGATAQTDDFNTQLKERLPWVFAFVLGLAFILLLVTFRSIVIAIKAILLNLLSVGAAYGLLTLVFQHGKGAELIGAHETGGITSWLPLFLFVVLFGLSMDYHVFILSRIREAYDSGLDTENAVAHGIKSTAGVVTSAALVMIGVFSIFATLSMIDFKEMGVGLATAVLIDATIVRAVLLPATMRLLGDWNWYLPKWLEWLPQIRHDVPTANGRSDDDRPGDGAQRSPIGAGATEASRA